MPARPPSSCPADKARARALRGLRIYFAKRRWPRITMALVVGLSGAAGFGTSYAMLRGGVREMWLRYPLAVVAGWLVFLGLMWLWAQYERRGVSDEDLERVLPGEDPGEREKV